MRRSPGGARLRAAAARVNDAVVNGGRSLDAALAAAEVPDEDRPLLWAISFGVLRQHWRLRASIERLLTRPLKARDRIVGSLLAVGLYQLSDTNVAPHAAVSLTVEAARLLRRPQHAGLVNACLRNYQRRPPELPDSDEIRFNHPAWLIERLRAAWPEEWPAILAANDRQAPMWLRVNRRRGEAAAYLAELGGAGRLLPGVDQAIRLDAPRPAAGLPGFRCDRGGRVSVQDAAAQLAAPWLLETPGADGREDARRILDACAAPGGKTAHLLELSPPGASLTAVDIDPERLASVRENLDRLGLFATLVCGDAARPGDWWDGAPYDRILLDAPCSATGVIRRHPDIRVLRRAADIEPLVARQRALLAALWPLLAPGGRLLYVTCSVLPEENEAVIGDFLARQPEAAEDSLLPNYNIRDLMCRRPHGYQVLPGRDDLDGFYYACLTRSIR